MSQSKLVFDFIHELHRNQCYQNLLQVVLNGLPVLIPGDNVMVGRHDASRRVMSGIVLSHPFSKANFLPEANESGLLGCHPFWDRVLDPVHPLKILSETTSTRKWRENPFYLDVLKTDRVRDHINVEFGSGPSDFTSVGVIRSRVGFSKRDKEIMTLLRSHFMLAFANVGFFERRLNGISRGTWKREESVMLAPGQPLISGAFEKRLRHLLGNHTESVLIPLRQWLAGKLDAFHRGAMRAQPSSWRKRVGQRVICFELRREGFSLACRLHFYFEQPALEKAGYSLTKREREVLFWLAEGKTDGEISRLLGIGRETVKTHLKQIYRKLDVDNRTSAARVALESMSL